MVVNDDEENLTHHCVLRFIASKLAPTGSAVHPKARATPGKNVSVLGILHARRALLP